MATVVITQEKIDQYLPSVKNSYLCPIAMTLHEMTGLEDIDVMFERVWIHPVGFNDGPVAYDLPPIAEDWQRNAVNYVDGYSDVVPAPFEFEMDIDRLLIKNG